MQYCPLGSVFANSLTSKSSSVMYSCSGKTLIAKVVFPDCLGQRSAMTGYCFASCVHLWLKFLGIITETPFRLILHPDVIFVRWLTILLIVNELLVRSRVFTSLNKRPS